MVENSNLNFEILEKGERILAGLPGKLLIQKEGDAIEVIGYCFDQRIERVLLFKENLPARFFDLSSGEAGAILQRFRNYRIKVAAVLPRELMERGKFGEMIREENRKADFRAFETHEEAEKWLVLL